LTVFPPTGTRRPCRDRTVPAKYNRLPPIDAETYSSVGIAVSNPVTVRWRADQFKPGSITQSERLAKYNRLLAIESETGWPVVRWPAGGALR
jgi:hypothetical protein